MIYRNGSDISSLSLFPNSNQSCKMRNAALFLSILLIITTSSCGTKNSSSGEANLPGVQSLQWSRYSAEAEALYIQGYNVASRVMLDSASRRSAKPWAVVLDIDETVLDNLTYNAELLRKGEKYSEGSWIEWCDRREAGAIPGALEFTSLALDLGIEVYYVSNRSEKLFQATVDNMRELGFPSADSVHILLKTDTSSKDQRREKISEHHDILLLIGDNLGDFDGIFDDRSNEYGKPEVRKNREQFGKRYIILPNPVYGTWTRGVFSEGLPGEKKL